MSGRQAALTVSSNVRALRQARGWTQAQLTAAIGLGWSEVVMGMAEHGRRAWTADEIAAAARALQVMPGRLFEVSCDTCQGLPPAGFACLACGAELDGIPATGGGATVRLGRRNRVTEDHLRDVVAVYREADADGRPPTRAVADHFETSHSTAARWVGHARRNGLLGPTQAGKAGEQP